MTGERCSSCIGAGTGLRRSSGRGSNSTSLIFASARYLYFFLYLFISFFVGFFASVGKGPEKVPFSEV